ncbi:putative methyltransferase [Nitrospirillum viridazoti Y2]|uniref:S-adenosyl-L-methionine-dependent methyltransferase n=1 Tax=Nitrospirillum amazonense TaxID=28077 RepID=A0A560ID83_9PROT|nr:class I SAM-dependent methyltransferase [Nitrospirillum amazonense]EGY00523.1 putative methyltransferase [Nitrospirillum amazonense Y2]TWB56051.1 methyltransferase (TIGR00027 family) [Nitrospirillum amazonense]
MHPGRPSRTALAVAGLRAAHQIMDGPVVFDDPVALPILGPGAEARIRSDEARLRTPTVRFLRASVVARSRFAEDTLATAIADGVRQYVVLGAGLDTFAYRNPYADLRVFEVDHPATQAWKRDTLATAGILPPSSVAYAGVDFERDTLAEGLARAGFDRSRPAFVAWLGVAIYLTRDAILDTLRAIAALPIGSAIVFDYSLPPDTLSEGQRAAFQAMADRAAAEGEPWRSFFTPDALAADLRGLGFGVLEDVGPVELNPRYFAGRTDGLVLGGISRLMHAAVTRPPP